MTPDPDGKIAALHKRALTSVVSVIDGLRRLQSCGNAAMSNVHDPEVAKRGLVSFREFSEACVEAGAAMRQYCDHMEPLLDGEENDE